MTALPNPRTFITSLLSSLPKSPPSALANPLPNHPSRGHLPPSTNDPTNTNPLKLFPPNARALLVTLHVLFPSELLPALDLLDRNLITRFTVTATSVSLPLLDTNNSSQSSTHTEAHSHGMQGVYHVRSAQPQRQSHRHGQGNSYYRYRDPLASSTHYEVRTRSWSCSCPAFAFGAFPASFSTAVSDGAVSGTVGEDAAVSGTVGEDAAGFGVRGEKEDVRGFENGGMNGGGMGEADLAIGGLSLGRGVPVCKHLLACTLAERSEIFAQFVRIEEVNLEEVVGWSAGWGG